MVQSNNLKYTLIFNMSLFNLLDNETPEQAKQTQQDYQNFLSNIHKQNKKRNTMTSIEAKVLDFEKRTGMKSNNIEWHILQNCAESISDEVEMYSCLSLSEFNGILDKYTLGKFKNPEFSAIRSYAVEDLKILGYTFTSSQVLKKD